MAPLLFGGWSGVVRALLLGTLAYVTLLFMLRVWARTSPTEAAPRRPRGGAT